MLGTRSPGKFVINSAPVTGVRVEGYLDDACDIERRLEQAEIRGSSELGSAFGILSSFDEHARLMFSMVWSRSISCRHHTRRHTDVRSRLHQQDIPGKRLQWALARNFAPQRQPGQREELRDHDRYHVRLLSDFAKQLRDTPDGDGNLLDHS